MKKLAIANSWELLQQTDTLFCAVTCTDLHKNWCTGYLNTVEPPKTDSPYYRNLHNVDKSPRSRIIPYTIVYVHKKTFVLRTPLK